MDGYGLLAMDRTVVGGLSTIRTGGRQKKEDTRYAFAKRVLAGHFH